MWYEVRRLRRCRGVVSCESCRRRRRRAIFSFVCVCRGLRRDLSPRLCLGFVVVVRGQRRESVISCAHVALVTSAYHRLGATYAFPCDLTCHLVRLYLRRHRGAAAVLDGVRRRKP